MSIREKVELWIKAEYAFRLADRNYTTEAQEWLLEAEDQLRESVAGHKDLGRAGEALGCRSKMPVKRINKKRQKLQTRKTKTTSGLKIRGLF